MHDTIPIKREAFNATLDLVTTTALVDCTSMDAVGDDFALTLRWPGISTGERLLWRVAGWLNDADTLPADDDLRAGLDSSNYAAVARLLEDVAA